jgi:hypothetical protein
VPKKRAPNPDGEGIDPWFLDRLRFTPSQKRNFFTIHCEIGEEIGVPFPFAKDAPFSVEDFNEWALKVGVAYIAHHPAQSRRGGGRHPGCAGERFSDSKSARDRRDRRARQRQRAERERESYLTWFLERYGRT